MNAIARGAKQALASFGLSVASLEYVAKLRQERLAHADKSGRLIAYLQFIAAAPASQAHALTAAAITAESQIGQDLFVLSELGLKRGGNFVEFGATNGISLSNSFLLERHFGWTGILAEPAKSWHQQLRQNRACSIEEACVWTTSGATIQFSEADETEYSTISTLKDLDNRSKKAKAYDVTTISLNDLLEKHGAPREIDYLSIDTEGSELEILRAFDFGRHSFRVITCEHNFLPARDDIFDLLSSKGYVRKFAELSKWDDWYVAGPK